MELLTYLVPVGLFVLTAGIIGVKVQEFDFGRAAVLAVASFILFILLAGSGLEPKSLPAIIFGVVMFIALVAYGKFSFILAVVTLAIWGALYVFISPPLEKIVDDAVDYVQRGGLED